MHHLTTVTNPECCSKACFQPSQINAHHPIATLDPLASALDLNTKDCLQRQK